MMHRSVLAGVGRILSVLALAVAAAPAGAQGVTAPGLDEAMRPDYRRQDLAVFSRNLGLDGTQREILEALYQDYETGFREGITRLRAALAEQVGVPMYDAVAVEEGEKAFRRHIESVFEDLQRESAAAPPEAQPEIWAAHAARLKEREHLLGHAQPLEPEELHVRAIETAIRVEQWRQEKARLVSGFEAGLQGILSEDQQELWPLTRRRLRKLKSLPRGRLSGESVDLRNLAHPLLEDPAISAVAEPILAQYELSLDAALADRDAYVAGHYDDMALAYLAEDADAAAGIVRGEMTRRARVRDVNERFAEDLVAALPGNAAADLRVLYRDRAWARVYRLTRGQRVYRSVREQLTLTPEAAEAIETMHAVYAARLDALNEQAVLVLRDAEPQEQVRRVRRRLGGAEAGEDPTRDVFAARVELDREFLDQIESVLSPAQIARIPGLRPAAETGVAELPESVDPRSLPTMPERWKRLIQMFDRNQDGRLDPAERREALEFLKQPPEPDEGPGG